MYKYEEYKGVTSKKCPIDYGKRILRLNWNMSSSMLDQYIYRNDKDEFFFVNGVQQHTACFDNKYAPKRNEDDLFHLALVTPIKSKKHLLLKRKKRRKKNTKFK